MFDPVRTSDESVIQGADRSTEERNAEMAYVLFVILSFRCFAYSLLICFTSFLAVIMRPLSI